MVLKCLVGPDQCFCLSWIPHCPPASRVLGIANLMAADLIFHRNLGGTEEIVVLQCFGFVQGTVICAPCLE